MSYFTVSPEALVKVNSWRGRYPGGVVASSTPCYCPDLDLFMDADATHLVGIRQPTGRKRLGIA